jgi:hypothetical protein
MPRKKGTDHSVPNPQIVQPPEVRLQWTERSVPFLRNQPTAFQPSDNLDSSMFQDIRYALRLLLRDRAFAFAALISLALGIGAAAGVFSVVDRTCSARCLTQTIDASCLWD